MKARLSTLSGRPISRLRVRSLGLGLYTAEVTLDDGWAVVCGDDGEVLRFTGMEWLRRSLGHLRVGHATLHHASVYNEMIGLSNEQVAPLEVHISWPGDSNYN